MTIDQELKRNIRSTELGFLICYLSMMTTFGGCSYLTFGSMNRQNEIKKVFPQVARLEKIAEREEEINKFTDKYRTFCELTQEKENLKDERKRLLSQEAVTYSYDIYQRLYKRQNYGCICGLLGFLGIFAGLAFLEKGAEEKQDDN